VGGKEIRMLPIPSLNPLGNWRWGKGFLLMSGKRYQIFMAPSAHRRYKKFDPLLKQKIKEEANNLLEELFQFFFPSVSLQSKQL
jgi:hypothetical protein